MDMDLQQQLEDAKKKIIEFAVIIEEVSFERDFLKREILNIEGKVRKREEEFLRKIDDGVKEKVCLEVKIYEGLREKEVLSRDFDILKGKNEVLEEGFTKGLRVLGLIKEDLMRYNDGFNEEMEDFLRELDVVLRLVKRFKEKLGDYKEKKELLSEIEASKRRNNEFGLDVLGSLKESILRINECLDNKLDTEIDLECVETREDDNKVETDEKWEGLFEMKSFFLELELVSRMAKRVESKIRNHLENEEKEKKELERNLMSLSEENRDVNALFRIALIEKEEVEKSVSKMKGNNNEQRRVPLLEFAERGLQRVGFGFLTGGGGSNEEHEDQKKNAERSSETVVSRSSVQSNFSSEYEEEVVSLASTMEKLMKNLRLEIAQLRRDLEESRSDAERLQSVTKKQAQQITEQTIYIQELKDREMILKQNVEELRIDVNAAEEDVVRWRKACELEGEAGKRVTQEHNKVIAILTQELEKLRTALQVSNKKLKSKEEVAVAAMAAQSAAERSLQLADRRNAGYRQRIEELTRELEELEKREKHRRKMSRICWPWQALNPLNAASTRVRDMDIKRVLPEMQAFLN